MDTAPKINSNRRGPPQAAGSVRLNSLLERLQQSLFFIPALFIAGAMLLAVLMVLIDREVPDSSLPEVLRTTVGSSRSILGAIAAGTITAASVVLSLTLVAVQLSSSQHSPRVLRNFIGDRLQQTVIGVVMGAFVYCVFVLRVVRTPLEDDGTPVVPNISVIMAIILGIAALLALLVSVDSTARGLKVESIASQVAQETVTVIERRFPLRGESSDTTTLQDPDATMPRLAGREGEPNLLVRAPRTGWVRQISPDGLLAAAPGGATVEARVSVGSYVMVDVPMLALHDIPSLDDDQRIALPAALCAAIDIGNERTMQQDVDFGFLRLCDIGLRALSPGVNDPNTAVEIVVRMGTVLQALVGRDLSGELRDDEGRRLVSTVSPTFATYVRVAFDQMREATGNQIAVYDSMLRTLGHLREHARFIGDQDAVEALREAGTEVLDYALRQDVLPRERRSLEDVAAAAGFVEPT